MNFQKLILDLSEFWGEQGCLVEQPHDLEAERVDRQVVLTKSDKVGHGQRARTRQAVQRELGLPVPPLAVSVKTGEGRRELLAGIDDMVNRWRTQHRSDGNG